MATKIPPSDRKNANPDDSSPTDSANKEVNPESPETADDVKDTEENNRSKRELVDDEADTPVTQGPADDSRDGPAEDAPLPNVKGKSYVKKKNNKKNLKRDDSTSQKEAHGEGTKCDDKKDAQPGETPRQTLSSSDIYKMSIFLVLAVVCLVVAVLIADPAEPEIKTDLDFVKIYENTLNRLQVIFTNQTSRFWKILKNRGLAHLRNTNPRQPLVFLLAAPPAAHDIVDCLATKLTEELDAKHKRYLALVDGAKERHKPGEKVKKDMDNLLIEKFQKGQRAALIRHLELLPPPSPLLFYSYCDDQNAPHKHVAIIFTVHLPEEPDLSLPPQEAEGTVEKYLANQVWAKEDPDSVAALLSRVADTVALMNGESSESAKSFCT